MDLAGNISEFVTQQIKNAIPEKTETELEQINYGIHVLLNNILKIPIVFLIAYFLGILKYTLVACLTFSFIRCFASGIHARKSITCLISTMILFIGPAFIGRKIDLNIIDITATFGTCLILIYFYAPADTEEKPLFGKKIRKKLKLLSLLSIISLYLICLILNNTIYANIITFSTLTECITILPVTYMIFKRRYNNHEVFHS